MVVPWSTSQNLAIVVRKFHQNKQYDVPFNDNKTIWPLTPQHSERRYVLRLTCLYVCSQKLWMSPSNWPKTHQIFMQLDSLKIPFYSQILLAGITVHRSWFSQLPMQANEARIGQRCVPHSSLAVVQQLRPKRLEVEDPTTDHGL